MGRNLKEANNWAREGLFVWVCVSKKYKRAGGVEWSCECGVKLSSDGKVEL